MNQQAIILKEIDKLKADYKELYIYGGLGYCGYMSSKLNIVLTKLGIESVLFTGQHLKDTPQAKKALEHSKKLFASITPDSYKRYVELKEYFEKHPEKIKTNLGHMVVLVGDTCYDATSEQFGFPVFYSAQYFGNIFHKLFTGEIHTTDPIDNFGVLSTDLKPIDRSELGIESMTGNLPLSYKW